MSRALVFLLVWINKYRLNLGDGAVNFHPVSALPVPFYMTWVGAYRSNPLYWMLSTNICLLLPS